MFDCKCIDNEQRKLLLQAVGAFILENRLDIEFYKAEPTFLKLEDVAVPFHEELIQKLLLLEQKIKEIPTCGPA